MLDVAYGMGVLLPFCLSRNIANIMEVHISLEKEKNALKNE